MGNSPGISAGDKYTARGIYYRVISGVADAVLYTHWSASLYDPISPHQFLIINYSSKQSK